MRKAKMGMSANLKKFSSSFLLPYMKLVVTYYGLFFPFLKFTWFLCIGNLKGIHVWVTYSNMDLSNLLPKRDNCHDRIQGSSQRKNEHVVVYSVLHPPSPPPTSPQHDKNALIPWKKLHPSPVQLSKLSGMKTGKRKGSTFLPTGSGNGLTGTGTMWNPQDGAFRVQEWTWGDQQIYILLSTNEEY